MVDMPENLTIFGIINNFIIFINIWCFKKFAVTLTEYFVPMLQIEDMVL